MLSSFFFPHILEMEHALHIFFINSAFLVLLGIYSHWGFAQTE